MKIDNVPHKNEIHLVRKKLLVATAILGLLTMLLSTAFIYAQGLIEEKSPIKSRSVLRPGLERYLDKLGMSPFARESFRGQKDDRCRISSRQSYHKWSRRRENFPESRFGGRRFMKSQ